MGEPEPCRHDLSELTHSGESGHPSRAGYPSATTVRASPQVAVRRWWRWVIVSTYSPSLAPLDESVIAGGLLRRPLERLCERWTTSRHLTYRVERARDWL